MCHKCVPALNYDANEDRCVAHIPASFLGQVRGVLFEVRFADDGHDYSICVTDNVPADGNAAPGEACTACAGPNAQGNCGSTADALTQVHLNFLRYNTAANRYEFEVVRHVRASNMQVRLETTYCCVARQP